MPLDDEVRRALQELKSGLTFAASTVTLAAAPATTTTVTRTGVSASSIIHLTARNANASNSDITRVVPANGSFVITHSSSASTRTFGYTIHTPQ